LVRGKKTLPFRTFSRDLISALSFSFSSSVIRPPDINKYEKKTCYEVHKEIKKGIHNQDRNEKLKTAKAKEAACSSM
jgi:hypothetical protein